MSSVHFLSLFFSSFFFLFLLSPPNVATWRRDDHILFKWPDGRSFQFDDDDDSDYYPIDSLPTSIADRAIRHRHLLFSRFRRPCLTLAAGLAADGPMSIEAA